VSLTDGTLEQPINRDEFGVFTGGTAWTNVVADGTAGSNSCLDWTSNSSGELGGFGSTIETDDDWTDLDTLGCHGTRRLYCFEQ
jgi:hypothetical protein